MITKKKKKINIALNYILIYFNILLQSLIYTNVMNTIICFLTWNIRIYKYIIYTYKVNHLCIKLPINIQLYYIYLINIYKQIYINNILKFIFHKDNIDYNPITVFLKKIVPYLYGILNYLLWNIIRLVFFYYNIALLCCLNILIVLLSCINLYGVLYLVSFFLILIPLFELLLADICFNILQYILNVDYLALYKLSPRLFDENYMWIENGSKFILKKLDEIGFVLNFILIYLNFSPLYHLLWYFVEHINYIYSVIPNTTTFSNIALFKGVLLNTPLYEQTTFFFFLSAAPIDFAFLELVYKLFAGFVGVAVVWDLLAQTLLLASWYQPFNAVAFFAEFFCKNTGIFLGVWCFDALCVLGNSVCAGTLGVTLYYFFAHFCLLFVWVKHLIYFWHLLDVCWFFFVGRIIEHFFLTNLIYFVFEWGVLLCTYLRVDVAQWVSLFDIYFYLTCLLCSSSAILVDAFFYTVSLAFSLFGFGVRVILGWLSAPALISLFWFDNLLGVGLHVFYDFFVFCFEGCVLLLDLTGLVDINCWWYFTFLDILIMISDSLSVWNVELFLGYILVFWGTWVAQTVRAGNRVRRLVPNKYDKFLPIFLDKSVSSLYLKGLSHSTNIISCAQPLVLFDSYSSTTPRKNLFGVATLITFVGKGTLPCRNISAAPLRDLAFFGQKKGTFRGFGFNNFLGLLFLVVQRWWDHLAWFWGQINAYYCHAAASWGNIVSWALCGFSLKLKDDRVIRRNLMSNLSSFRLAELSVAKPQLLDLRVWTPLYLLVASFDASYWFNPNFLLSLQHKEGMFHRGNPVFDALELIAGRHRRVFSYSTISSEFGLFSTSLQFFDSNLAPSLLVTKYLTQIDCAGFGDFAVFGKSPKLVGGWVPKPRDSEFLDERFRRDSAWGVLLFPAYLDSWALANSFVWPHIPNNPVQLPFRWVDFFWHYNNFLGVVLHNTVLPLVALTAGLIRDYVFFLVGVGVLSAPSSTFFESIFVKLTSHGFGFIFPQQPALQAEKGASYLDWYGSLWHMWRWRYLEVFKYRVVLSRWFKYKALYLPNIYSIFEYISTGPTFSKLPTTDNWLLTLDFDRLAILFAGFRKEVFFFDDTRKRNFWRYPHYYFTCRKLIRTNRLNLGPDVREKGAFFEKPFFRLVYLMNYHTFSIAPRRDSVYFSGFMGTRHRGSELKSAAGRWSTEFLLNDVSVWKFYYRHWTSKQALSVKFLEHEKAQFFKHFKNIFALRRFGFQRTDRDWLLTKKFRLYRADRLNNRVAFFFDTLKKNLMFGLGSGFSAARASGLVVVAESWFFRELPFSTTFFQSLGAFENNFFRFIFYLNDCVLWSVAGAIYWLLPFLTISGAPQPKLLANHYFVLTNYFPYFSSITGDLNLRSGSEQYTFFFISLKLEVGVLVDFSYRVDSRRL